MKLQTKLTASIGLIVFFSISVIFLGIANRTEKQIFHELKNSASILFQQIILTRTWIADHGGVYIEKTGEVESSPYLDEPDIKTVDGKTFTLRNPALVVRDLSRYADKLGLFRFHMTSLNLLNPLNKPDEFEKDSLERFEKRQINEAYRSETIDGKKFFRLMAPLYTTESCLQCHAHQGYEVGDVRGGLSVFVPMDKANLEIKKSRWLLFISGVLVIIFVELVLYFLINRIVLKPISSLARAAKMLKEGNYETTLERKSNDEIGDLTERFQSMKETILLRTRKYKESEEKYRALSETAMDAIVSADSTGTIILFNKAAEEMFQYKQDEIIGQNISKLMPKRYLENHKAGFKRFIETRNEKIVGKYQEFDGRRKNGEEFPLDISISPYEIGDGLHFSAIIRDLTEKKRMEASFLQAEKLSSVGGLVAGVAHELNNPLTGIIGYSELILENEDLEDDIRKDLERIHNEAERSAKIVKNLLTFSREHKHEKKVVQINSIIEDTMNLVRHQFDLKGIGLESELAPDLKKVYGDPHQLQQAFVNIINNAAFAMEEHGVKEGKLVVKTGLKEKSVRISLSNNGPCIESEAMKKIFDPFFTTKDVGKGTGLGLSIVFGIIREHHGTLEAENLDPQGVAFIIELPIIEQS